MDPTIQSVTYDQQRCAVCVSERSESCRACHGTGYVVTTRTVRYVDGTVVSEPRDVTTPEA